MTVLCLAMLVYFDLDVFRILQPNTNVCEAIICCTDKEFVILSNSVGGVFHASVVMILCQMFGDSICQENTIMSSQIKSTPALDTL